MLDIDIRFNANQLADVQALLAGIPGGAEKAMSRSLNKTLAWTRTRVVRAITDRYEVSATDVRATLNVHTANPKSLEAWLKSTGSSIPVEKFKTAPKQALPRPKIGVSIQVRKGTGLKPVPGAFKMPGNPSVFRRTTKARFPIKKLYGLSIPQMLGSAFDNDGLQEQAQAQLAKELAHQTDFLLMTGGKK